MDKNIVRDLVKKYEETVVKHYQWLHAHPELSNQEKETAAYIAAELRKMGLEPREGVGGYGVIAVIEGKGPGKCVGLRADIDALPMTENTGLPFASQNPGVMHACGHDAHASMLLGAALVLNEMRDSFDGCIKLIFQPSEENSADSGAKRMIADGALENPHVDAMIGQHVDPTTNIGVISSAPGPMSAASDRFFITVEGKSSHAARPHTGIDAVAVGAQIVSTLNTIISRNVDASKSSVMTIGKFNAGDRYNVLAGRAEMEGTCRNYSLEVRALVEKRMRDIVHGVAEGMGAKAEFKYIHGFAPLINDAGMVKMLEEIAIDLCGAENVVIPMVPGMGGEDFSFFAEKVPAVFYRTGCHKEGEKVWPAHNENMVVDPGCFPYGMQIMVNCALTYLEENA